MRDTYYLDLVKAFYSIFKYRDGVASRKVKCISIILNNDIWKNVAKLSIREDVVNVLSEVKGFNRLLPLRSFLKNPWQKFGKQLLVGGLKIDERRTHYKMVWILCPKD